MTLMTNEHLKSGRHPIVWVDAGPGHPAVATLAATAGQSWVRIIDLALLLRDARPGLNIVVGRRACSTSATWPLRRGAYLYAPLSSPSPGEQFRLDRFYLTGGGVFVPGSRW